MMKYLILFIVLIFYSCSSPQNSPYMEIEGTWIRTANSGMNSAAYCDIKNKHSKDDKLLKVSCTFAKKVEVHETYMQGDDMGMRKAGEITIKANSSFEMEPGGYHVMFIKLTENLKKGDKKEIEFHFKNSGVVKVEAEVK